jgi:predicted RNase H-like HicB family nuclease
MERTLHLAVTVTPDHDAGGYVARAVDVEVASQGETEQEALAALTEALELYFEDDEEAVRARGYARASRAERQRGTRMSVQAR